jgi:phosphoglycolate phosphatase-like HAD superfamily hydrolase
MVGMAAMRSTFVSSTFRTVSTSAISLTKVRAASTAVARPVLRGVVFDMDGTLTKPNLDFAEMYQRCGVPMQADLLAAIAAMQPAEQAAAQAVIDEMEAEGRRTLQLMPGAIELATWLHRHGVPTAVVTRNTALTVAHLQEALWLPAGLPPFSPAISRDDEHIAAKPDPAALHAIGAAWSVPVDGGLLMVGDSPKNDVAFGKANSSPSHVMPSHLISPPLTSGMAAGVSTALLDSGRRCTEGGADGGADIVVDALARLPHALWTHFEVASPSSGPLKKYPTPSPSSAASAAAATGDTTALAALPATALDAADGNSGNTPLVWAADAGHADAVRLLLQRCANAPMDVT